MLSKAKKILIYVLVMGTSAMMAQSCNSTKKCGCGSDINKVYKQPKYR